MVALFEALVLFEDWKVGYNTQRPHNSLEGAVA